MFKDFLGFFCFCFGGFGYPLWWINILVLTDWPSSWLLWRHFGGLVTPSDGSISLFWRVGPLLGFSDVALVGLDTPSDGSISLFWRIGPLLGFSDVALVGLVTPSDGSISLFWRIGPLLGFSDVALVGWLTPSGGLISLFDGLALFLASLTSLWWVD